MIPEPLLLGCTKSDVAVVFPKIPSHGQHHMVRKSALAKRISSSEALCEAVRSSEDWFMLLRN